MIKASLVFLFLAMATFVNAQDPKFSQYFASPLTLNPALTGYFDGNYRAAINTRQQWANVGDAYNTLSASGELKFQDEYYYDDILSIGVSALYDESFNKVLKSYTYGISASYYKFLDPNHNFKLGLAPQVSYVSRQLDYDALTVASQYQNGQFNLSIPNNLGLDNDRLSYFDLNIGANLALTTDRFSAALGYAVYHLTRPKASLFNDINAKMSLRSTINASLRYVSHDLIDLNFSSHCLLEGKSSDLIVGGLLGFRPNLESKMKLNTGIWYQKNGTTFFPFIGLEVSNIAIGLNYSLFTKSVATYKPRTFELSLILNDQTFTKFKNTCKF
jgi:type IX secretion system PorP/SprF family membrane protein